MEQKLLFLIGSPRSGSTLLARMLGAHSAILAPAEPHLLTPLAHLGYYASVEQAPLRPDHHAQTATRELVRALPGGESDYLAALRAYSDAVYERLLEASGRTLLLDKTPGLRAGARLPREALPEGALRRADAPPAGGLVAPTSSRSSTATTRRRTAHNPLLERYVPAIARFLRERPVPLLHRPLRGRWSRIPTRELRGSCAASSASTSSRRWSSTASEGDAPATPPRGLGDPITVARETRPTTQLARALEPRIWRAIAGARRAGAPDPRALARRGPRDLGLRRAPGSTPSSTR